MLCRGKNVPIRVVLCPYDEEGKWNIDILTVLSASATAPPYSLMERPDNTSTFISHSGEEASLRRFLNPYKNTDLKSWEKKRTKNTHAGNEPESRKKVKAITVSCNMNSATWSSFTAWSHSGKLSVPFLGVFERSVRMKSRVLKVKKFLLKKPTYVLVNTKITQKLRGKR